MRRQEPFFTVALCLLSACGGSSGGGSGGGGASSGGGASTAPSFVAGGHVVAEEDTASSQGAWATEIQNGIAFELTPADPSLFASGPTVDGFGELSFLPAEDAYGSTDVTVILRGPDGQSTEPITMRIDIMPVNDPPSFVVGPDAVVEAGSGSHFIPQWASGFSPGPENEASQELSIVMESNTNPELFQVAPIVDSSSGNLYFNVLEAVAGEATITLRVEDDGGLGGLGAENASESVSFKVIVTDSVPPTAAILYPPDGAKTDADSLLVRGTAYDAVGVDFLRVNGLHASSDNGFETWMRESFPAGPASSLTIQLSDVSGNFEPGADNVTVHGGQPLPIQPRSVVYDLSRGRLIFHSASYEALLSYDPSDGTVEVFAEPTDDLSWSVSDLHYRSSPPGLFAIDDQLTCVLSFDLSSGEATVVSGLGVGDGPSLQNLRGITAVQGSPNNAPFIAVIDSSFGPEGVPAIVAISPVSGDRSALSANAPDDISLSTGDGPEFGAPAAILYQHSQARFLVTDSGERALFSVERDTGDRVLLITNEDSSDGSFLGFPTELLLSSNGSTAWVLDPAARKVFEVNMAANTFSTLTSGNESYSADGYTWTSPRDFARVPGTGLFVTDYTGCALYTVSTSSGSTARTLDFSAGEGPAWSNPTAIEVDEDEEVLLLSCADGDAIYSVSLRDGSRALVSGAGVGAGPSLLEPQAVSALGADTLIVTDVGAGQPRVLSVDRASGDRALLSGQGVGGGVSFNEASSLAVDPGTDSAYILDGPDETITRVGLSNGGRFRVAGGGVGVGTPLANPTSIAWDQAGQRIIVLQAEEILAVDPISLNRTVLCDLSEAGFAVQPASRISCPPGEAHALITLPDPLSVVQVSLATGATSTLIDMANSSGPPITDILDVATSAVRQTAYLLSKDSNALYALDESGGGHVLFSRD